MFSGGYRKKIRGRNGLNVVFFLNSRFWVRHLSESGVYSKNNKKQYFGKKISFFISKNN